MGKSLTEQTFLERVREVSNGNIIPLEPYIKSRDKIWFYCDKHGKYERKTCYELMHGDGCSECRLDKVKKATTKTNEQFLKELSEINPNIIPLEPYINAKTPIKL